MIVVGDNLRALIRQHNIIPSEMGFDGYDETSIALRLGTTVIKYQIPVGGDNILVFGSEVPKDWVVENEIASDDYLVLAPGDTVLACSYDVVNIPIGYFGFLQTKGSLARLFVSVHCSDSQIDPGFSGKITFEIINYSKMSIKIKPKQIVGNLYIFKASTKQVKPYNGRYQNSNKPTVQQAEK